MSFSSRLRNLRSVIAPAGLERQRRPKPSRRTPAARYQLRLELLEDRLTPSTLTVTTALDGFDGGTAANPAGPDGMLSLREAISAASNGDQIRFDQSLSGSTINLDPTKGHLLIDKNLDILGPGANDLAVSGQDSCRVFLINTGATDTISGLTIKNGRAGGNAGGIRNDGTLTVSNCVLSGNVVIGGVGGGGIVNGSYGSMTVSGCTLFGNSGDEGGGIYNDGTMTVSDSTLSGNYAPYGGAGIYNNYGGTMTVSHSTVSDNFGSGIYNYGPGTLNLTDSTVSDNASAGIVNFGGSLTVSGSTLSGNTTGIHNFAITASTGYVSIATLAVSKSTLSDNFGYGIYSIGGSVTVTGSALSRNGGSGILNGSTRSAGGQLSACPIRG